MKKNTIMPVILSISSLVATFPLAAFAIDQDIFDVLSYIINTSIVVLIGIATLLFMYGVIVYVLAKGDEKQLSSGKTYMLWGIIGLTVMVAVWGFVNLIIATIFGVGSTSSLTSPDVKPSGTRVGSRGTMICIFGVCF